MKLLLDQPGIIETAISPALEFMVQPGFSGKEYKGDFGTVVIQHQQDGKTSIGLFFLQLKTPLELIIEENKQHFCMVYSYLNDLIIRLGSSLNYKMAMIAENEIKVLELLPTEIVYEQRAFFPEGTYCFIGITNDLLKFDGMRKNMVERYLTNQVIIPESFWLPANLVNEEMVFGIDRSIHERFQKTNERPDKFKNSLIKELPCFSVNGAFGTFVCQEITDKKLKISRIIMDLRHELHVSLALGNCMFPLLYTERTDFQIQISRKPISITKGCWIQFLMQNVINQEIIFPPELIYFYFVHNNINYQTTSSEIEISFYDALKCKIEEIEKHLL